MSPVSTDRHTQRLVADAAGIALAASILRAGGLVAFPTETVYGLGADALNGRAVGGIFEAKGRPPDDPLIVHLARAAQLETLARPTPMAWRLADRFWPGPLTIVLPKLARVPSLVTAGLQTVAVRVPAHPVARALLEAADLPLAAPSANLFGRPSPTRAEHVLDDLAGRIDAVLDGGPTPLGLESTIVDVSGPRPRLLRPGGLAKEEIENLLGEALLPPPPSTSGPQAAPGLLAVHYSPRTPLTLVTGATSAARDRLLDEVQSALASSGRFGLLALDEDLPLLNVRFASSDSRLGLANGRVVVEVVGSYSDPARSAAHLYHAIRTLDALDLSQLFVRELADTSSGLGRALADRLRRASRHIVDTEH